MLFVVGGRHTLHQFIGRLCVLQTDIDSHPNLSAPKSRNASSTCPSGGHGIDRSPPGREVVPIAAMAVLSALRTRELTFIERRCYGLVRWTDEPRLHRLVDLQDWKENGFKERLRCRDVASSSPSAVTAIPAPKTPRPRMPLHVRRCPPPRPRRKIGDSFSGRGRFTSPPPSTNGRSQSNARFEHTGKSLVDDSDGRCNGHRQPASRQRSGLPPKRTGVSRSIERWLQVLLEPGQVIQLFVKDHRPSGATRAESKVGFYDTDNLQQLAHDALTYSGKATAVYTTLNPLAPSLLQHSPNRLTRSKKGGHATNDSVTSRRWIRLDFDPVRDGVVSATEEEKEYAKVKMELVTAYLKDKGWPPPLVVDSGNGFHLVYRIDLPTDDGGLIKQVLQSLSRHFSDEHVHLDTSVHDPVRLIKLPGTMACKGENSPGRPHRRSRLLRIPKGEPKPVSRELLEQVAADLPVDSPATSTASSTAPPEIIKAARS